MLPGHRLSEVSRALLKVLKIVAVKKKKSIKRLFCNQKNVSNLIIVADNSRHYQLFHHLLQMPGI